MLAIAATWTAVVLGLGIMLIMAVGPALSGLDGWFAERRTARSVRSAARRAASTSSHVRPAAPARLDLVPTR